MTALAPPRAHSRPSPSSHTAAGLDHTQPFRRGCSVAHQSESGRDRNERQEHDRKSRLYEETTGNPYHLSKGARAVVGVLAVMVVITVTALFVGGVIHW